MFGSWRFMGNLWTFPQFSAYLKLLFKNTVFYVKKRERTRKDLATKLVMLLP